MAKKTGTGTTYRDPRRALVIFRLLCHNASESGKAFWVARITELEGREPATNKS